MRQGDEPIVDKTSPITGKDFDLFNTVAALSLFFSALAIAYFGTIAQDLNQIIFGVIFALTIGAGILFARGILSSPANVLEAAFGYTAGQAVFYVPAGLSGLSFSLFSVPTAAYLSLLSQTPNSFQVFVNTVMAPGTETYAFVALMAALIQAVRGELDLSKLNVVAGVVLIAGVVFAGMHAGRTVVFFLMAVVFMAISGYILFGTDLGLVDIPYIPVTIAFLWGIHKGNNTMTAGGPVEVWSVLWSAQGQEAIIFKYWVVFDLLVIGLGLLYVVLKLVRGELPGVSRLRSLVS